MFMTRGLAGLRTAAVALGLVAFGSVGAHASALINYTTSGQINSTGVTGSPGVISFNSIQNDPTTNTSNSFNTPSDFSLGQFVVAKLPDGQSTTYTNTPFSITFLVNTVNGTAPNPNQTPIVVTGELNGTVTGSGQSNVEATFDPITKSTFLTGTLSNTLSIPNSPLSLVPSTTNGGQTSAQAFLTATDSSGGGGTTNQVPEPTSIALFLTVLGGIGIRQRLRAARS